MARAAISMEYLVAITVALVVLITAIMFYTGSSRDIFKKFSLFSKSTSEEDMSGIGGVKDWANVFECDTTAHPECACDGTCGGADCAGGCDCGRC